MSKWIVLLAIHYFSDVKTLANNANINSSYSQKFLVIRWPISLEKKNECERGHRETTKKTVGMQSEKPTHRYKCYAMGTFKRKRTRSITKIIRVHHKQLKLI